MARQISKKKAKAKPYPYPKREVSGVKTVSNSDKHWYDLPEEKIAGAIEQIVNQIDNNNQDLREQFMRNARMYGTYEALGLNNLGFDGIDSGSNNYQIGRAS